METALLIFALVMSCLAVGVVVTCVVSEASEAWNIHTFGWARGHRLHHGH